MSDTNPLNTDPNSFSPESNEGYLPKPELIEKNKNSLPRSLISLFIYGLFFYFLFNQNIAYIAAILVVIIIHEMGHFLTMKLFDYSNVKIFILPLLGAFTSGKKQIVSQWQLSLIILAGPVPGILIGSLLFWMNKEAQNENIKMLTNSFLIINLLNCLPLHPLDGGRFIETLFFKENHLLRMIFGIMSIIGLLIVFLISGSPLLIIVPIFIAFELRKEFKHEKIRSYLRTEKINYHLDYLNLSDKNYWLIRDCLVFSFPKKYFSIKPGVIEYTLLEPILVQHISSLLQINLKKDLNILSRLVMLFILACVVLLPLTLYYLYH